MEQSAVPPWTLGWRLRRAMEHAGVSQMRMMAEYGVSKNTISRWTHDDRKRPLTRRDLRTWAEICGVDFEWLVSGAGSVEESAPEAGQRSAEVARVEADLREIADEVADSQPSGDAASPVRRTL